MKSPKDVGKWEWNYCFGGIAIGNELDHVMIIAGNQPGLGGSFGRKKAADYAKFIVDRLNDNRTYAAGYDAGYEACLDQEGRGPSS
jgi:pimeloyl-ACP methyl ester carboxylesterase